MTSRKLPSKLFNFFRKSICTLCSKHYTSVKVESENVDSLCKIHS